MYFHQDDGPGKQPQLQNHLYELLAHKAELAGPRALRQELLHLPFLPAFQYRSVLELHVT